MFCLVQKCKLLKQKSKEWNQTSFGNIFRQLRLVDARLQDIQNQLMHQENNISLQQQQELFLTKLAKLMAFNVQYRKQRSRINYLLKGDSNSKFYHAHASIRRNKNLIKEISLDDETSTSNPFTVLEILSTKFCKRFSSNTNTRFNVSEDCKLLSPIITQEDNDFLCAPVSGEEIKNAIFDLAPD